MSNEIIKNENEYTTEIAGEVANPFGGSLAQVGSVGAAQAVSHELAEMPAQIYLAKQFPRDQRKAAEQILTACQRPGLAEVAVYAYAKGGTQISGPSIRLAEEIARDWGNLECGWDELEREYDASKIRAFAWDKETNVLKTLFFYVPHYRTTKKGRNRITDERELYELLANQAARRMRNCILALIPGDVVDAAVEQCRRTLVTHCDITPETIKKLVAAFEQFGVSKAQIEKRIQRRIDSIAPAQFVRMREIYTSLRDGISTPSEWFDMEVAEQTSATDDLKNRLAFQGARNTAPITSAEPEPAKNTSEQKNATDGESGTPGKSGETPATKKTPKKEPQQPQTVEGIYRQAIADAKTAEDLNGVDEGMKADDRLDDNQRDSLRLYLEQRYEEV